MKIADFNNLIKEIPFLSQSFEIKKKNWTIENQQDLIDKIFNQDDVINISRQDLFDCRFNDVEEFILKTLMWGYPTKGRGRNIDKLLEPENFKKLTKLIDGYKYNKDISIEQLKKDFKNISSIGISTITKLLYFLYMKINECQAVILDLRVIEVINSDRFDDFNSIRNISYQNAFTYYPEYLKIINQLSEELGVYPDQIEMFLFVFGNNLTQPIARL